MNLIIKVLPHVKKFIESKKRFPALVGGYGCGKTVGIAQKACQLLVENQGHDGLISEPTYRMLNDIMRPAMDTELDNYGIPYTFEKSNYRYITPLGKIILRSLDKPQRLVGFNLAWFLTDELDTLPHEKAKEAWNILISRLRVGNFQQGGNATTPEGFRFTWENWQKQIDDDKEIIKAKTSDNIFLPKEYIESLKSQYDEMLLSQYFYGEFVNMNGHQAYYFFNREKDVIPQIEKPTSGAIMVGIDFNVNPLCMAVSYYDENGLFITFDEYYLRKSNTYEAMEILLRDYPKSKYRIIAYPDMTGIKRQTNSVGVTDIDIIQKSGIIIKGNRNPLVKDRLNCTNNALDKQYCKITSNCTHLIEDLERVVTDEKGRIDPTNHALTHISDAWSYNIIREFPINKIKIDTNIKTRRRFA